MTKKDDGPAVELGQVYQRLKKGPKSRCTVMALNDTGVVLKDDETGASHHITVEGLPEKFRLVGKHVSQGGEAKFVPLHLLASVPPQVDLAAHIKPGARFHYHDDPSDTIEVLEAGNNPGTWWVHEKITNTKALKTTAELVDFWRFYQTVQADRTDEPADPPLTGEQGVIHEAFEEDHSDEEEREDADDEEDEADDEEERERIADQLSGVNGTAGQERPLKIEFKNKECRVRCHCHQALIMEDTTWAEMVKAVDEFREMHRAHLSPMPRPGELPFKGKLKTQSIPKTDAPAASAPVSPPADVPPVPANGAEQPAANAPAVTA